MKTFAVPGASADFFEDAQALRDNVKEAVERPLEVHSGTLNLSGSGELGLSGSAQLNESEPATPPPARAPGGDDAQVDTDDGSGTAATSEETRNLQAWQDGMQRFAKLRDESPYFGVELYSRRKGSFIKAVSALAQVDPVDAVNYAMEAVQDALDVVADPHHVPSSIPSTSRPSIDNTPVQLSRQLGIPQFLAQATHELRRLQKLVARDLAQPTPEAIHEFAEAAWYIANGLLALVSVSDQHALKPPGSIAASGYGGSSISTGTRGTSDGAIKQTQPD
ncbi:hypothetical protein ACX80U_17450 [Arthrobacter sp. TmT3-37]